MQSSQDYRQLYSSMVEAFDALNLNYFVMEIICDENGVPVDGIYRQVNPATVRLIGKKREEIIGKSRRELFGNIVDEFPAKFYEVIKTGQPVHFESHGAATKKHYDVYAWKVTDNQVAAVVSDITEHKKVEAALRASDNRFRLVLKNSPVNVSSQDLDLRYTWIYNPQLGYSPPDVIGKTDYDLLPAETAKTVIELKKKAITSGAQIREEVSAAYNNSTLYYDFTVEPMRNAEGKIVGVNNIVVDITEHKKTEKALQEANKQLETTINSITDGLLVLDKNWRYTYVSATAGKILGMNPKDLIGGCVWELFPHAVNSKFYTGYHEAVETGKTVYIEEYYPEPLNMWLEASCYPSKDGLTVYFHDISERKNTENELRKSEEQKNTYLESMTDGFVAFDKTWRYTYVNSNAAKILQKPKEELIGKAGIEIFPNATKFLSEFKKAVSTSHPVHFEEYYPEPLNIWYECHCYPTKDGLTVFFSDITERKNAEKALKASEEQARQRAEELQKLMDIIPAAIWISNDPECKNIVGNDTANHFYEAAEGENVSAGPASGSEQDTTRRFFRNGKELSPRELPMQEAASKNIEVRNTELEVLRPSGNKMTMLGSAKPLLDNKGKVRGCIGLFVDISERKKAEEELENRTVQLERTQKKLEEKAAEVEEYAARMEELARERTDKLERTADYARNLIEASVDPLVTISAEGKITDVNRATELATGCSREELIGSNFSDYFTEPQKAEEGYKKVLTEGYVRDYPLSIKSRTGEIVEVLYNAAIYYDKAGNAQGVFAAARDITERKKLEKQLQEKDRLAAIGATAGMVGHDIRNPLQSIIGDIFLAKSELEGLPDSQAKKEILESLIQTESNIDYINKIIQDLQDYARPLNPKCEEIDLQAVFERAVIQSKVPQNIKTYIQVDPKDKTIRTDIYYLNRILYNLITNSVQAMPNGGELTIQAYREKEDTVISVKDNGAGIPVDIRPKMFTVMFTTKSKGQGFGLPVVKRMTESLGGKVSFESVEGRGTRFTLRFPAKV